MAENCSLCCSSNIKKKFVLQGNYSVHECKNCSLQFLFPQLNDAELEKLYSESYYSAWGLKGEEENPELKKMKISTFDLRLKLIFEFRKNGNLLDVGCATGYMLEASQEKGFVPYGVELSEYSASIAKKKFGENVFKGRLEDSNFPPEFFDVITMFDLLEHVRDPKVTLHKASELLKNDGIIMITTPDTDAFSNLLMGRRWTHYKPEHFFYFNKKSMSLLAKKCKLKIVYSERSKKALNLDYIINQFKRYNHRVFTPLAKFLDKILPGKLKSKNLYLPIGEMTAVLKKIEH
jgi:SAM-dependent methyltransferase